jgi:Na+/H+ antiporter NhaD/arsenite permease-like protein
VVVVAVILLVAAIVGAITRPGGVPAGAAPVTAAIVAVALRVLPRVSGAANTTALLFGVNAGPTIPVTGSLSGLLWLDAARRNGLDVGGWDYARVGLIAGVPALLAGTAMLSLISAS